MLAPETSTADAVVWLKAQARQQRPALMRIIALSIGRFAVTAFGLWLIARLIANAVIERSSPEPAWLASLAGCFVLQWMLTGLIDRAKQRCTDQLLEYYQQQLTRALESRSLAMVRDRSIGEWQSFFTQRIPALPPYFADYVTQQQVAGMVPLLVLLLVAPVSWLAALLLAVAAPLIPLFMWLVGKGAAAAQQRNFIGLERLAGLFLDRLNARQLLHVHNAISHEQTTFNRAGKQLKTRTMEVLRLAFLSSAVLDFFATLGMALVAVFVGFSLLGEITFGSWGSGLTLAEGLFLLLLAPVFFSELKELGRNYHLRAQAIGAAAELHELLDFRGSLPTQALPVQQRNIQIYGAQGENLLCASDLCLAPGDRVLLEGPSGSGKTTLLECMLGLRPQQTNLDWALPLSQVAWFSQQPTTLRGSVRVNITLGTRGEDEHLTALLARVELADWLAQLPHGLDTLLGDYPPLSGGQLQRLALARLLFFDRPIVVLDEPTAHLGEHQATRLSLLLQRCFKHKTVLWVGHHTEMSPFFNRHWRVDVDAKRLICRECEEALCA
ncbi:ABC transporter ATP-binding protein/permease [Teredinibacter turnerae]|uniref:ABC transporter ATP-binding protein/permease n=1 Tax=Teredinibacter turnerae TaxID=2426 RepID=UPI0030CB9B24